MSRSSNNASAGRFPPIREVPLPADLKRQLLELGYRPGSTRHYRMGRVTIQAGKQSGYRYLSISHPERDPTWDEIKHVQNELRPGVFFCMPMPPEEWWLSIAPRCYHVYEVKDEALIGLWKEAGEAARGVPEGTTLEDEPRDHKVSQHRERGGSKSKSAGRGRRRK